MKTQKIKSVFLTMLLLVLFITGIASTVNNKKGSENFIKTECLDTEELETIGIEEWMYNDSVWKLENKKVDTEETTKLIIGEELEILAWMTDDNIWKLNEQKSR